MDLSVVVAFHSKTHLFLFYFVLNCELPLLSLLEVPLM